MCVCTILSLNLLRVRAGFPQRRSRATLGRYTDSTATHSSTLRFQTTPRPRESPSTFGSSQVRTNLRVN